MRLIFALGLLLGQLLADAQAHKASDSYLHVSFTERDQLAIRWDLAIRDLQPLIHFDRDNDAAVSWQELMNRESALVEYALNHLAVRTDRMCLLTHSSTQVVQHGDGGYVVLNLQGSQCTTSDSLALAYSALGDVDMTHRGLVDFRAGNEQYSAVLVPNQGWQTVGRDQGTWSGFTQFVSEGVWHVWIGFDHILFLLTLLLPCLVARGVSSGSATMRSALGQILAVVTAFTVAHSITLGLAMTGLVRLPPTLVEISIALSVTVVAVNNLIPFISRRHWLLAGIFGLIHGFGFAGAMSDLDLEGTSLLTALAGFNLGVELGQAAIVLVFVPLVWQIRDSRFYQLGMVRIGSAMTAIIGLVWATERWVMA